jgi:hypothetical protein
MQSLRKAYDSFMYQTEGVTPTPEANIQVDNGVEYAENENKMNARALELIKEGFDWRKKRDEGKIIIGEPLNPDGTRRVRKNGTKVGAIYIVNSDNIVMDLHQLSKGFKKKAWTKPQVAGVVGYPEDQFKNVNDWINFIAAHEWAHKESHTQHDPAPVPQSVKPSPDRRQDIITPEVTEDGAVQLADPYKNKVQPTQNIIQEGTPEAEAVDDVEKQSYDPDRPGSYPRGAGNIVGLLNELDRGIAVEDVDSLLDKALPQDESPLEPLPPIPGVSVSGAQVAASTDLADIRDVNIRTDVAYVPVAKIISGGQTGADIMGLLVANHLGIETGGTAAPGYAIENKGWYPEFILRATGMNPVQLQKELGLVPYKSPEGLSFVGGKLCRRSSAQNNGKRKKCYSDHILW